MSSPVRRPVRRPVLLAALAVLAAGALAPSAGAVQRRAFATSVTGTGDLHSWADSGGLFALAAADNVCRVRAAAGGLANASTYRAWMSTAATDAYCHVQGLTGEKANGCSGAPQPAGPWYPVSGTSFTGGLDELTGPDGVVYRGALQDETGEFLLPTDLTSYWTGTAADGTGTQDTCASWVVGSAGLDGTTGDALSSAVEWTDRFDTACDAERRLLCLEPGASDPVGFVPWAPAKIAFVTSTWGNGDLSSWPEAGDATGLEAGDAICATLAAAAHLPAPESFVALLSDSTVDARDRLTIPGVPIRRLDHFRVANSNADLLDGTNLNSLHVDETGAYVTEMLSAFTGSLVDGTYEGASCLDWTSTSQPGNVRKGGVAGLSSGRWISSIGSSCAAESRLYCIANAVTIFWDGFDRGGDTSYWSSVVAP
jgi:hypothetical protein